LSQYKLVSTAATKTALHQRRGRPKNTKPTKAAQLRPDHTGGLSHDQAFAGLHVKAVDKAGAKLKRVNDWNKLDVGGRTSAALGRVGGGLLEVGKYAVYAGTALGAAALGGVGWFVNSALDAIICVDQHQRITVFNPTAAALFQCSASDALGSPLQRFLPDAVHALAFAQLTTQALLGENDFSAFRTAFVSAWITRSYLCSA
jgi:PAS domain-containing protein